MFWFFEVTYFGAYLPPSENVYGSVQQDEGLNDL